jgi:hypothetical protein
MFNCFNVRHSLLDSALREDQELLLGRSKSKKCQDAWVWWCVSTNRDCIRVKRVEETVRVVVVVCLRVRCAVYVRLCWLWSRFGCVVVGVFGFLAFGLRLRRLAGLTTFSRFSGSW